MRLIVILLGVVVTATTCTNSSTPPSSLASLQDSPAKVQSFVVTIGGVTREIGYDMHACDAANWNSQRDACTCCLTRLEDRLGASVNAEDIIDYCIAENYCTNETVTAILNERNAEDPEQALPELAVDVALIHRVDFAPDREGLFNDATITQFLAKAYAEKKLKLDDFSSTQCMTGKNIRSSGGFNTVQLFSVGSTCAAPEGTLFIVKEAKDGIGEAINLNVVAEFQPMQPIILPNHREGFPSVALPYAYLSYPTRGMFINVLSVQPAAQGKALCDFIRSNTADFNDPKTNALVKQAYYSLGVELGNFQKSFMEPQGEMLLSKTVVHGDFKCLNIFYDQQKSHYTFIDNETMADTVINLGSPMADIAKILFGQFVPYEDPAIRTLYNGLNERAWYTTAVGGFIEGYISVYAAEQQQQVLSELKVLFNTPFSTSAISYDENAVAGVMQKYINPLFDRLLKEI